MFTKNLIFLCSLICKEWMVIYTFGRLFIKTPELYLASTSQFLQTLVLIIEGASLGSSDGKESTYSAGDLGLVLGLVRFPWKRTWQPIQYSCLENPHGQKSPAGYSPWSCKEPDMTEWLSTAQQLLREVILKESSVFYTQKAVNTKNWIMDVFWAKNDPEALPLRAQWERERDHKSFIVDG